MDGTNSEFFETKIVGMISAFPTSESSNQGEGILVPMASDESFVVLLERPLGVNSMEFFFTRGKPPLSDFFCREWQILTKECSKSKMTWGHS